MYNRRKMSKQKGGYVSREGLFLLHKGEPVEFIRHKGSTTKFYVVKVNLSKKAIDRVAKEIKESLAKHFGTWDKPKKPEKVWSVS